MKNTSRSVDSVVSPVSHKKSVAAWKRTLTITTLLGASVLLAGCTASNSQQSSPTPRGEGTGNTPAQTEKVGDTRKTGVVTSTGGRFYLTEAGSNTPAEIDSYGVDLSAYVGQTITVVGQYSGDTLFVGSVE